MYTSGVDPFLLMGVLFSANAVVEIGGIGNTTVLMISKVASRRCM